MAVKLTRSPSRSSLQAVPTMPVRSVTSGQILITLAGRVVGSLFTTNRSHVSFTGTNLKVWMIFSSSDASLPTHAPATGEHEHGHDSFGAAAVRSGSCGTSAAP